MSTASEPNVMTIDGVPVKPQSTNGTDYVKKVTHPPTTLPTGYCGVPDASQPNFVPLEVKCEQNIQSTYTIPIDAATTAPAFPVGGRILLVSPSGGYVGQYIFYWNGAGWVQTLNQVPVATVRPAINGNVASTTMHGYNFDNLTKDFDAIRTVYKSNTVYLNATDFNNQGTVTDCKFKPSVSRTTFSSLRESLDATGKKNLDRACRPIIDRIKKSAALDNEFVNLGPLGNPEFDFNVQVWTMPNDTTTLTSPYDILAPTWTQISGTGLPNTPDDVLTASPKATTRMAREGTFTVQQPVDPVQLWTNLPDNSSSSQQYPAGCTFSILRANSGTAANFVALHTGLSGTGGTLRDSDVPWNNLDWTFTMFDGLSQPTFNESGIPINAPYLTDKGFCGIEGAACPAGSLMSFQKLLPLPDPEALQMAAGIFHARPDSLPAAANDMGTIAKVAMKWLPTAVSWLRGVFAKNPGLGPDVARVAQVIANPRKQRAPRARPQQPAGTLVSLPQANRVNVGRAMPRRTPPSNPRAPARVAAQLSSLTQAVNRMSVATAQANQAPTAMRSFTNNNRAVQSLLRPVQRPLPQRNRALLIRRMNQSPY